ncbi:MADS-box protein EJ2 [Linum perenne]
MGRRKVELKRIDDKSSRQVTFSKRRKGLIKKAGEISVLCDVHLALAVFSSGGRLYEFCSGDSFSKIVRRYKSCTEEADPKDADSTNNEFAGISPSGLLEIIERYVDDDSAEDLLTVNNLVQLENRIDLALTQIKERKMQLMLEPLQTLQEQETKLRQENEKLKEQIAAAKAGMDDDDEDRDNDDDNDTVLGTIKGMDHDSSSLVQPGTLQLLQWM